MRPQHQPIPVQLAVHHGRAEGVPENYEGTGCYPVERVEPPRYDWDDERVTTEWWVDLPPTSLIIVQGGPKCDFGRYHMPQERNAPRIRLGDLDGFVIEPHTAYFKRQFRKTRLLHARWHADKTETEYVSEGRAKKGCNQCKRAKRSAWWGYRWSKRGGGSWNHGRDRRIGCNNHVRTKYVEVPHPDAGKVFAVFSTEKLLGVPPGSHIIAQMGDEWKRATVGHYPFWDNAERKRVADATYDKKAAAKLKLQKEKTNTAARKRARARARQTEHVAADSTWLERLVGDDLF